MKSDYKITLVNADAERIANNLARVWGEIISESTPGIEVTLTPIKIDPSNSKIGDTEK